MVAILRNGCTTLQITTVTQLPENALIIGYITQTHTCAGSAWVFPRVDARPLHRRECVIVCDDRIRNVVAAHGLSFAVLIKRTCVHARATQIVPGGVGVGPGGGTRV